MDPEPINIKLEDFSKSIVKDTASNYNKAFHAKLFTLFASSESSIWSIAKEFTPNYGFCFCFIENDEAQYFLDGEGIEDIRNWIIEQCRTSTEPISSLYRKWQEHWENYLKEAEELERTNLTELNDEELYNKFRRFYSFYLLAGSIAYACDSFMSAGEEDWLESLIKEELEKVGIKQNEMITHIRTLTSPVHQSFSLESEYKLLKIAETIDKEQKELPKFSNMNKETKGLLEKHSESFHWIENNYYNVHRKTAEEFYNKIKIIIKESREDRIPIIRLLEEKENQLKKVREERQKLIDSLGISDFLKNLLETAKLFAKWKDIRKSGVYIGMYHFDNFLKAISERTQYSKTDLTFALFDEIEDILLNKKDLKKEISERKQRCFYAIAPDGYYIAGAGKADEYFNLIEKADHHNLIEIKGVPASPGKITGRVRIIRKTEEMKEFLTGEILVTNQTTPDFLPVMKKAAGIITEQGGITSHAAIVSRELKKPCIIGTKIATSALKDGETIEMDAEKGIIIRKR